MGDALFASHGSNIYLISALTWLTQPHHKGINFTGARALATEHGFAIIGGQDRPSDIHIASFSPTGYFEMTTEVSHLTTSFTGTLPFALNGHIFALTNDNKGIDFQLDTAHVLNSPGLELTVEQENNLNILLAQKHEKGTVDAAEQSIAYWNSYFEHTDDPEAWNNEEFASFVLSLTDNQANEFIDTVPSFTKEALQKLLNIQNSSLLNLYRSGSAWKLFCGLCFSQKELAKQIAKIQEKADKNVSDLGNLSFSLMNVQSSLAGSSNIVNTVPVTSTAVNPNIWLSTISPFLEEADRIANLTILPYTVDSCRRYLKVGSRIGDVLSDYKVLFPSPPKDEDLLPSNVSSFLVIGELERVKSKIDENVNTVADRFLEMIFEENETWISQAKEITEHSAIKINKKKLMRISRQIDSITYDVQSSKPFIPGPKLAHYATKLGILFNLKKKLDELEVSDDEEISTPINSSNIDSMDKSTLMDEMSRSISFVQNVFDYVKQSKI